MKRRTFIKTTSLAVAGTATAFGSCKSDPGFPIIDTHQHMWDLELFPLTWVSPPLDRNFLTEDYLEAVKGHQVAKAIYMEVGAPESLRKKEALWALKLCEDPDNPTVAAVIKADPTQEDFESYITSFEGNPYLKGIRYTLGEKGREIPDQAITNVKLLGRLGFSLDVHWYSENMLKGAEVLDQCPDVRFILNHCGSPDPLAFLSAERELPREPKHDRDEWYRNIEVLASRPNIVCKISGIVDNAGSYPLSAEDLAPIIDHCISVFGPDRVMFGGDWPVCLRNMSLGRWIDVLKEIVRNRPVAEQKKLFHDNAFAFYGLGSPD